MKKYDSAVKLRDFLVGRWSVLKSLDYRIGGGRGTLTGETTISPFSGLSECLSAYLRRFVTRRLYLDCPKR